MPRPKLIEELHGARYDREMAPLEEKARFKARYDALLAQAAKEYESNEMALRVALYDDYRLWRRQNRLPKPPR